MTVLPPLETINRVTFYKRDELTTDLICCDVESANGTLFLHEEADEWPSAVEQLACLEGFRKDWLSQVSQPPFQPCTFVAYERA